MRLTQRTKKPIILVVDDTPENIDILKGALLPNHQVRPATNGQIALRAAKVLPNPDLILLDIMMPGMDGYEVCQRLKADPVTRDIPIIFVTAKAEVDDELRGLELGAVDYIIKPFSIPIVLARVSTHLALRKAHRELDARNQLLLEERDMIERMIVKMRHADHPDERHLRHLIAPVETTAGDMLLSAFTPDGRQLVMMGDFTGHGLSAAIGGPLVGHLFGEKVARGESGGRILHEINQQLCLRLPTGIFFAVALAEIAPDRSHARLWSGGMPDIMRIRNRAVLDRFSSRMLPLGIIPWPTEPEHHEINLLENDLLYLYSDGIIEAVDAAGEPFGLEKLEGELCRLIADGLPLEELLETLNHYVGATIHEDDITLAEVRA
ncbi:MAG: SpoIIE family protein phosphatase [Magnetococcales bacterium]|nr:SpoIIE family protein phosphatase [Magnetococcales bacterium]